MYVYIYIYIYIYICPGQLELSLRRAAKVKRLEPTQTTMSQSVNDKQPL